MDGLGLYFIFFFWPYHEVCGILVPPTGIKPVPLAMEAGSQLLDHQESPGHRLLVLT